MATNLAIDPALLDEARKCGGFTTKKAAVEFALREFVARRKRKEILKYFGKMELDRSYNYKKERSSK